MSSKLYINSYKNTSRIKYGWYQRSIRYRIAYTRRSFLPFPASSTSQTTPTATISSAHRE